MLARNRVSDFDRWKQVFDSQTERAQAAGLNLVHLWRSMDDPDNVFFLFEVADIDRATEFLNAPESAEAGRVSGVLDGEYHFLQDGET
jgi:hypothetical protein